MSSITAKHPIRNIVIGVTLLVCIFETLSKGWITFRLLPISLVVLPVYVWTQYAVMKYAAGDFAKYTRILAYKLSIFLLLFYVCMVGVPGDTHEVILFGFYTSTMDATITHISGIVSQIAGYAALLSFVILASLLLVQKSEPDKTD